jgi:alpha-ketoglutarate-dependent taurine dioxygenase
MSTSLLFKEDSGPIPIVTGRGEIVDFTKVNVEAIQQLVATHGVVLLRGFTDLAGADLEGTLAALSCGALDYLFRSTPRTSVEGRVFTATEYPNTLSIPMHSELSYHRDWPMCLVFGCLQPASEGGETPIADLAAVTRRLGSKRLDRFAERGVLYIRNYGHGVDLNWQTVFQTDERLEVERYCRAHQINWEWLQDERLKTWHVCQGAATHPQGDVPVWFNQAHLFHVSALPEEVRDGLTEIFGEDSLPRHAFYGDGEPIPDAEIAEINAAFDAERIFFSWRRGDVLLVDNMRFAHGRMPYAGARRVLVAMGDAFSKRQAAG